MDNNDMKINIRFDMGKYFLTTGATQSDPNDTCIFPTNQSTRKAMKWAFYHLSGRQSVFISESLGLSDYRCLL